MNLKDILESKMMKRKMSLRRLAQKADVPSGRLSEILNGKRPLTLYYLNRLARILKFDAFEMEQLKSTLASGNTSVRRPDRQLHNDELTVMKDWYYFAILNILKLKDFKSDPKWIAASLGLTEKEVTRALRRLIRLDLIQIEDGAFQRTSSFLSTTTDIPSTALQEAHIDKIMKAVESIRRTPVEYRGISSMTVAISESKVPEIKEEIRRFRQKLAKKYEAGEADSVYNLSIQFIPYTKRKATR